MNSAKLWLFLGLAFCFLCSAVCQHYEYEDQGADPYAPAGYYDDDPHYGGGYEAYEAYDPELAYELGIKNGTLMDPYIADGTETAPKEPTVWSRHDGEAGMCSDPGLDGTCTNPDAASAQEDDFYLDEHDMHPLLFYDNCQYIDVSYDTYDVNGTEVCDLVVEGADLHADLLGGGIDGVYEMVGCFEGKPLYVRADSPENEQRNLFFNPYYGDWEFSVGERPSEDQLVLYGDHGHLSPLDVGHWHLAAALNSNELVSMPSDDEDLFYVAEGITVKCAPGADS